MYVDYVKFCQLQASSLLSHDMLHSSSKNLPSPGFSKVVSLEDFHVNISSEEMDVAVTLRGGMRFNACLVEALKEAVLRPASAGKGETRPNGTWKKRSIKYIPPNFPLQNLTL